MSERLPSRTCVAIIVSLAIASWALVYALVTHPLPTLTIAVVVLIGLPIGRMAVWLWRVLDTIHPEAE